MIRVLLADDQALVRGGFRALLDARDDIEVVGEAADGHEALALGRSLLPDVILMDIRMPGLDGLETTRQIAADPHLAAVRIIILTTFELDEYLFDALRFGASGLPGQGHRARRPGQGRADRGRRRRPAVPTADPAPDRRVRRPRRQPIPASQLDVLTERERQVVALVAGGLSNDEIASQLVVSPATARTHVSRAMIKLNARDRTQLAVLAYETGLVRPGWQG